MSDDNKQTKENYCILGEQFPPVAFKVTLVISLSSMITNLSLGLVHILNYVGLFVAAFCVITLLLNKSREWLPAFVIVVALIYCPSVFIVADGFNGSNPLFAMIVVLLLIVLLPKKIRWFLVLLLLVIYISLSFLQLYYPHFFVSYPTTEAKMQAMCISIILGAIGIASIGKALLDTFSKALAKSDKLLEEIHIKNKQLEELSVRDPLTGLYNRRYMLEAIEFSIQESIAKQNDLCLLFIDIDHFKLINDQYGHNVGDQVLCEIADKLSSNLRSTDILARYGGEEFVILLPNTNKEEATIIAERLRSTSQANIRKQSLVTISIGLAKYRQGETGAHLVDRADKRLYIAKDAGRDKLIYEG